jgi:hypothetical protein
MDRYQDHISDSESFETIFWIKIPKFFDADADPGIFLTLDPRSRIEKFGSGIWDKSRIRNTDCLFIPEELSQVHVVWCLLETKTSAVVEIHGELSWESLKYS